MKAHGETGRGGRGTWWRTAVGEGGVSLDQASPTGLRGRAPIRHLASGICTRAKPPTYPAQKTNVADVQVSQSAQDTESPLLRAHMWSHSPKTSEITGVGKALRLYVKEHHL